jgi:hypothetical protein
MHSSSGNIVLSPSCPANAGHPLSSCPANAGHLSSSLRAEGFGKTNLGSAQAPPRGPVRTARLPNPSATPACGSGVAISSEVEKSPRHSTAPSVPVIPRPVRGISPSPATRWTFLTSSGSEEDHAGRGAEGPFLGASMTKNALNAVEGPTSGPSTTLEMFLLSRFNPEKRQTLSAWLDRPADYRSKEIHSIG